MSADAESDPVGAPRASATTERPPGWRTGHKLLIYRHSVWVRLMHWVNVITLAIMLMSGLQIFNARPDLYWGATSDFSHPVLGMFAMQDNHGHTWGVTTVGSHSFVTTGLF